MALPNDMTPTAPLATIYITPDDVTVRTAMVKLPPTYTRDDIEAARNIAYHMTDGDWVGAVMPPGWSVEWIGQPTRSANEPPSAVAAKRKRRILAALSEHIAWGWLAAAVVWLVVWGVVSVYAYLFVLLTLLGDAFTGSGNAPWVIAAAVAWWVFGMVLLAALVMRSMWTGWRRGACRGPR